MLGMRKSGGGMEERREIWRCQVNQPAELTFEDGVKPIPCFVEDISTRGLRLAMSKEFFPEVFSGFNLTLADDFSFNAGAEVVWTEKVYEKNVYGLAFNRLEEEAKLRINQYIKDNFPEEMSKQIWSGI